MTKIRPDLDGLLKRYKELEFIINKSPVVVILWKNEEDWPVEFVSENISQFGYTREEFMSGKIKYSEIIHPKDLERVVKEVEIYSKRNLNEFTQEYRILSKSKEILWIDDRTYIRRNPKGEITHFQGTILDITEKKKIQEELESSEHKFRMISEQILVGIGILQDGKVVYANKKATELFGYSLDDMKKWSVGDFAKTIHPEDLKRELTYVNQIQNDPNVNEIHFQTRGIHKTGKIFWAEALFRKFNYNNRPALLGIFVDITERKKAENALRFTQFSVDNSADPAFWMDHNFRIIYVNKALCESLGYSREELLKMTGYDLNPYLPKEAWKPNWEKIKENGSIVIEAYHKKKNGEIIPVEVYVNYLKYDGKEYNCAFVHDISERKESERKLKESEEKYREAYYRENFYKDLFAHDIKNILQSISNSLEIYEYKINMENHSLPYKQLLNNIHSQIDRATHLVSNIEKFSELETYTESLKKIEIFQLIQNILSTMQKTYKNKNINIQFESDGQKEFYFLGNDLINEVIENILLNSIIHNDNEDVQISIVLSKILKNQKSYIRVEFSDNGRGIEDLTKDIIFNRAFQQNKSTTGMGLGLSLVKIIIDNLNGYVWVEDRVLGNYKHGSKFVILLPEVD